MKTVIVLGMHRSATSLLAKSLNHEIYMGDQVDEFFYRDPNNPEGYFENWEFVGMNDRLLADAGGTWFRPPKDKEIAQAAEALKPEMVALVDKTSKAAWRSGKDIWGWKDPRTTLTIRHWLPLVENPHIIAAFRDPQDVAKSMQRAHEGELKFWLRLANLYNTRLVKFLAEWNTQQKRLK